MKLSNLTIIVCTVVLGLGVLPGTGFSQTTSSKTTQTRGDLQAADRPDRLPKMTNECGFGDVYDWKALDDHRLIVWFNSHNDKNARVLELNQSCHSLHFVDTIALKTRDRFRVCSYGGDSIIVDGQRCSIGRVRTYNPTRDIPKWESKRQDHKTGDKTKKNQ